MGWSLRSFRQKVIIVVAAVMVGFEILQSQWVSNAVLDFCFGGVIPGTDMVIDPDIVLGVVGGVLILLAVWLARHRLDDFVHRHPITLNLFSPGLPAMRPPSRARPPLSPKLSPKALRPAGHWLSAGGSRAMVFCRQALLTVVMSCLLTYSLLIFGLAKGLRWVMRMVGYVLRMLVWSLASLVRLLVWSVMTALRWLVWSVSSAVHWLLWALLATLRAVVFGFSSLVHLAAVAVLVILKVIARLALMLVYGIAGLSRSFYKLSVITWRRSEPHLRRTDAWLEVRAHKFYRYLERKAFFHPSLRFGLTTATYLRRQFDKIRQFEGL